jgi:hypothetical protein
MHFSAYTRVPIGPMRSNIVEEMPVMDPPHVHAIVPDHLSVASGLAVGANASTPISDAVPLLPFAMDRIADFA